LSVKDIEVIYVLTGEVTTLSHKVFNDPMELATLIAESHFAGAKSSEVLCGIRDDIIVEKEVNTTPVFSCNSGIKSVKNQSTR